MKVKSSTAAPGTERHFSEISFMNFAQHQGFSPTRPRESGAPAADGPEFELQLIDHLFPYAGCSVRKADYVWGVYGYRWTARVAQAAYNEAEKRGLRLFPLPGTFRVKRLDTNLKGMDRDAVRDAGFLHTTTVRAGFRRDIESRLLARSADKYPGIDLGLISKKSLGEILFDYPMLLEDLFDLEPTVDMIVHPVRLSWESRLRSVDVCTMRRLPGRIAVEVQNMPDIAVTF